MFVVWLQKIAKNISLFVCLFICLCIYICLFLQVFYISKKGQVMLHVNSDSVSMESNHQVRNM